MKNKLVAILILIAGTVANAKAQYYYSDIIGTKQTNQQYRMLRSFEYKRISATSFEGTQPAKDFLLEQTISKDGNQITTRSASIGNSQSIFTSYFNNNKVAKTVDSGTNAITTILYDYDKTGKLASISSTSKDFDGKFTTNEVHLWSYNDKGQPSEMLKVKNKLDTTVVAFKYDEEENVAEEIWKKNNRVIETYYYYHSPKKLLTDIVRYNRKGKNMLPDFIFEYDNQGHITRMTQTQGGSANYLVWNYTYNENGMKEKETVFNKQKELLGRIEYKYQ